MYAVTSKDGTRIAYDKNGSGPALILVDGAFCFRHNGPATMLVPELSRQFTLYTYDRRGRGESWESKPYAVEREIEDLQALLAAAGGAAYLVGISSGAALALRATAAGLNVPRLALFEPPYVADSDEGAAVPADAIEQLNALLQTGSRSEAVRFYMQQVIGMPALAVALLQILSSTWRNNKSVAHTLVYDLKIMGDFAVPTRLAAAISVPTLVLNGSMSPINLRQAARATVRAIPEALSCTLPGQGHWLQPKLFTRSLVEFFNRSLAQGHP
jgi:pimeloyl-ACP methyl ester carboxylesterase